MITISGVVQGQAVVIDEPLPEGTKVRIVVEDPGDALPPDLQAEITAWGRASERALDEVERLAWQDDVRAQG